MLLLKDYHRQPSLNNFQTEIKYRLTNRNYIKRYHRERYRAKIYEKNLSRYMKYNNIPSL